MFAPRSSARSHRWVLLVCAGLPGLLCGWLLAGDAGGPRRAPPGAARVGDVGPTRAAARPAPVAMRACAPALTAGGGPVSAGADPALTELPALPARPPALAELLAAARAVSPERLAGEVGPGLFLELAWLLRTDPAAVDEARGAVAGAPPAVAALILDALGDAGTPAARAALLGLAREPLPAELLPNLYLSLGQQEPTRAVVAALEEACAAQDARRARWGLHGLGSMAARAEPACAEALVARLERELDRAGAHDVARAEAALEALGNAGHARAIPSLLGGLAHGDPRARQAAAYALRKHTRLPGVETALALAGRDPSPLVRAAAVEVLAGGRLEPLLDALADQDPGVRLQAVEALGSRLRGGLPLAERARQALERAALADEADGVRALARHHLGS